MKHLAKVRAHARHAGRDQAVDALAGIVNLAEKLYAEEHSAGRAFADQILATIGPDLDVRLEFGPYGALIDLAEEK